PGRLVQIVSGDQQGAAGRPADVAHDAQRLDHGGDAALHVRRPAAGQAWADDLRCDERQMYGVEVAVELQGATGLAGVEADDDRRGRGVPGDGALDGEAVGFQDLGEPVRRGPAVARRAGHLDELDGRV